MGQGHLKGHSTPVRSGYVSGDLPLHIRDAIQHAHHIAYLAVHGAGNAHHGGAGREYVVQAHAHIAHTLGGKQALACVNAKRLPAPPEVPARLHRNGGQLIHKGHLPTGNGGINVQPATLVTTAGEFRHIKAHTGHQVAILRVAHAVTQPRVGFHHFGVFVGEEVGHGLHIATGAE